MSQRTCVVFLHRCLKVSDLMSFDKGAKVMEKRSMELVQDHTFVQIFNNVCGISVPKC